MMERKARLSCRLQTNKGLRKQAKYEKPGNTEDQLFFCFIHRESTFFSCPTVMLVVQVFLISSNALRALFQLEDKIFIYSLQISEV